MDQRRTSSNKNGLIRDTEIHTLENDQEDNNDQLYHS